MREVVIQPFRGDSQWRIAQEVVAYQHRQVHLRIMHAHLAFCLIWCKSSGRLCIYNGDVLDSSKFWYIHFLEKKVNGCVLVANPTWSQVVPFWRLSHLKGFRLSAGGTGGYCAIVSHLDGPLWIGHYYGCCGLIAIMCNRKPNTYELVGSNRNACRMLISNEIR